jgi:hypothetical protein
LLLQSWAPEGALLLCLKFYTNEIWQPIRKEKNRGLTMDYKILETLYEKTILDVTESLHVVIMNGCLYKAKLRKIKQEKDEIWLVPGESKEGFTFPFQEAQYVSNKHNLNLEFHTPK